MTRCVQIRDSVTSTDVALTGTDCSCAGCVRSSKNNRILYRSCVTEVLFVVQATIYTEVVASVAQPEQVTSNVSNMLTFVFEVSQDHVADVDARQGSAAASPRKVKRVLPATNEEAQKLYPFFR